LGSDDRAGVIGPPGTGKTAFLVRQGARMDQTRLPLGGHDIKPEIYGIVRHKLEAAGYKLITYNQHQVQGFVTIHFQMSPLLNPSAS